MVRKTPAATAEPMTPATFGPMAGISGLTLPSVSSETNFCTTRAAIGTAETPAAPMQGLIFFPSEEQVEDLGKDDPAGRAEGEGHRAQYQNLERVRGQEILGGHGGSHREPEEDGHDVDERATGRLPQPFRHAAFTQQISEHQHADQRSAGGDGQRGQDTGHDGEQMTAAVLETGMACGMSIARSLFVVSSRMMGGWMIGTSDM